VLPPSGAKGDKPVPEAPLARKVEQHMPGLPPHVLAMLDEGYRPGTCGACNEFDKGKNLCKVRLLNVTADMVSCPLYDPKGQ
jgi:hypothetical protein